MFLSIAILDPVARKAAAVIADAVQASAGSHLRAAGIGANLQLMRRMQIPQPHSHGLGKSSARSFGSAAIAQLGIARHT